MKMNIGDKRLYRRGDFVLVNSLKLKIKKKTTDTYNF